MSRGSRNQKKYFVVKFNGYFVSYFEQGEEWAAKGKSNKVDAYDIGLTRKVEDAEVFKTKAAAEKAVVILPGATIHKVDHSYTVDGK